MSGTTAAADGAARDLLVRLAGLRSRVAGLVELRSADDPTATDPLRGLYVTPERARALAATRTDADGRTDAAADEGDGLRAGPLPEAGQLGPVAQRFDLLVREFGLTELDAHILLCALAPDVDRGFEPLYGYLNDDVGRRRATVALALDLAGTGPYDPAARARFHPSAPLVSGALIAVEDADRPLPGRALRVPERVVAHLLGDDALDPELTGHEVTLLPAPPDDGAAGSAGGGTGAEAAPGDGAESVDESGDGGFAARLGAFVVARSAPVYLRERRSDGAAELAADALCGAGLAVLRYRPGGAPPREADAADTTAAPAAPASAGVSA
ncbi:ATP-binding protein, partial [Streptomyces celluloflavus]